MNKYVLVALLIIGVGAQPILSNDAQLKATKKEKINKSRKTSATIACVGALIGFLMKTIANQRIQNGVPVDIDEQTQFLKQCHRINQGASAITLVALLTAIGHDVWKGDRNILGAGFTHAINAGVSQFVASLVVGIAL